MSNAELTLRIPADKLDAFIAQCSALGTVLHESIQTRDITDEYYDATARLPHLTRNAMARLPRLTRNAHVIRHGRLRRSIDCSIPERIS